jgi:hypothetical protein
VWGAELGHPQSLHAKKGLEGQRWVVVTSYWVGGGVGAAGSSGGVELGSMKNKKE